MIFTFKKVQLSKNKRSRLVRIMGRLGTILTAIFLLAACTGIDDPECPTPAESAYLDEVSLIVPQLTDDLSWLRAHLSEDRYDLIFPLWDVWNGRLKKIYFRSQDLLDLNPPASISAVSRPLEEMAQGLIASVGRFAYWFYDVDVTALSEGIALSDEALDDLDRYLQALESHCKR